MNKKLNISVIIIFLNISLIISAQSLLKKENILNDSTFAHARIMDINKLILPINNFGILGHPINEGSEIWGNYENVLHVYNSGFGISGYEANDFWASALYPSGRVRDYQAGPVGRDKNSSINQVYEITKYDSAFGKSWLEWDNAVKQGAKFYDGNNDGIYNPIDLNNNGIWDNNEDKPYFIGDKMLWTVYNDGISREERVWKEFGPKLIEIKQTAFAYSPNTYKKLEGTVFVNYEIENKSDKNYTNVYFSFFTDIDNGDYSNDLIGCDTSLNAGFVYNSDHTMQDEPTDLPAFILPILQGPFTYIPNETFIDNNENGIYDINIDIPLDTAYQKYGDNFELREFIGAKNQNMNSFMFGYKGYGDNPYPTYNSDFFRLAQYGGKELNGDSIYVSTFPYGNGIELGADTLGISSKYLFSGDPESNNGWLCTYRVDQAIMVSTGPFSLEPNKPVDILVAFIVGRGTDAINSVSVSKQIAKDAIGFYESNFTEIPVSVAQNKNENIPSKFVLEQNYPNPFNPTTTIKYRIASKVKSEKSNGFIPSSLPASGVGVEGFIVRLTVYDILGREVSTLVNQKQKPGNYEINFDASKYSSGVYYYQLKVGQFIKTKKMMLLK